MCWTTRRKTSQGSGGRGDKPVVEGDGDGERGVFVAGSSVIDGLNASALLLSSGVFGGVRTEGESVEGAVGDEAVDVEAGGEGGRTPLKSIVLAHLAAR